jgi:hypothetical protein
MTLLEQALSKKALSQLDRFRTTKGIRSRKKALEMILEEVSISASGLPYTGDLDTDEILDDPELTKRLLEHKKSSVSRGTPIREIAEKYGIKL